MLPIKITPFSIGERKDLREIDGCCTSIQIKIGSTETADRVWAKKIRPARTNESHQNTVPVVLPLHPWNLIHDIMWMFKWSSCMFPRYDVYDPITRKKSQDL
jgi:hypothetical protein